jgi:hypothetical protein
VLERCLSATHGDFRHKRAFAHQALDPNVPEKVCDLYMAMSREADWRESPSGGVLKDMRLCGEQAGQVVSVTLAVAFGRFRRLGAEHDRSQ